MIQTKKAAIPNVKSVAAANSPTVTSTRPSGAAAISPKMLSHAMDEATRFRIGMRAACARTGVEVTSFSGTIRVTALRFDWTVISMMIGRILSFVGRWFRSGLVPDRDLSTSLSKTTVWIYRILGGVFVLLGLYWGLVRNYWLLGLVLVFFGAGLWLATVGDYEEFVRGQRVRAKRGPFSRQLGTVVGVQDEAVVVEHNVDGEVTSVEYGLDEVAPVVALDAKRYPAST